MESPGELPAYQTARAYTDKTCGSGNHYFHPRRGSHLSFSIQAPDDVADSNSFTLDISWLECKDLCQPGSSTHHFVLMGDESPGSEKAEWTRLVERAELRFPQTFSKQIDRIAHRGDHVELALKRYPWSRRLRGADFFPFDEMIYASGTPVQIQHGLFRDRIRIPLQKDLNITPEVLYGVLVLNSDSPGDPHNHPFNYP